MFQHLDEVWEVLWVPDSLLGEVSHQLEAEVMGGVLLEVFVEFVAIEAEDGVDGLAGEVVEHQQVALGDQRGGRQPRTGIGDITRVFEVQVALVSVAEPALVGMERVEGPGALVTMGAL